MTAADSKRKRRPYDGSRATRLLAIPVLTTALVLGPATSALAELDLHGPDRPIVPGAIPGEVDRPLGDPGSTAQVEGEVRLQAEEPATTSSGGAGTDSSAAAGTLAAASAGYALRPAVRGTADLVPDILLRGQGWGHSVGLSQFGAYALALLGATPAEILTHYYSGTEVTQDPRASTDRIRVGIATGQSSTQLRAIDGSVAWQLCTPASEPARNGRVPASRCAEWFTQPAGSLVRVRPVPAAGLAANVATSTHVGGEVTVLARVGEPGGTVRAPFGGLAVEQQVGGAWVAQHVYITPDDGRGPAQLPVARAVHGDDRIEAQSYAAPDRRYAFGWRDVHLTGERTSDPVGHRLAVVQDVDTVERYLRGLAEVPSSWPSASLEAQAIAGRTYALRGSRGGVCRCDRLATASDQVFIGESKVEEPTWGVRWAAAVEATRDQVLTFEGSLAETYYSSSFGGRSENVQDSWAYYRAYQDPAWLVTSPPPAYLRSVDDPYSLLREANGTEIRNSRRDWTARASNAALATLVNRERIHLALAPFVRLERVRIASRTEGGTPLTLEVAGVTGAGARETMTYRGMRTSDGRTLARPVAGATLRMELPLVAGGESNGRISSSQLRSIGFGPFLDDDGSVHEYAISWAAQVGVVRGIDDERFAPTRSVTRAQMATYLVNTFQIPAATLDEPFPDVPVGATHRASIEALAAAGISAGYDDGTFQPDRPVTRSQMATFLANTLGWSTPQRGSFTDVPPDDVHGPNIEAIAVRGVTTGCTATRYCGADPVERGQLASFLHRVVRG